QIAHSVAAQVHKGEGFHQQNFFCTDSAAGHNRFAPTFGPFPAPLPGQPVYYAKADVVPRLLILLAWIAQADYQFHEYLLPTIGQAYRQVLRQTSQDDLLLCFLKFIWDAVKIKGMLFAVIDHKGRSWVSVAWLANASRIDDRPVFF